MTNINSGPSYVSTNKKTKIVIGGKNVSQNLIGGTVSDSDITSGGIVFTTGSLELAGYTVGGEPIVESKFSLGDLVTISASFAGGHCAKHPRSNLYVVNIKRNFTTQSVTIEVACRLSVIKDFGTNDNDEVKGYIQSLSGIDSILDVCQIDTFDLNALDSALRAIGSFAYMAHGRFTVQRWEEVFLTNPAFTSWTERSSLSVEDLEDVIIPPTTLSLTEEIETPGYPETDPDEDETATDPTQCVSAEDCRGADICLEGFCETVECGDTDDCPEGYTCLNGLCTAMPCSGTDDCPTGFICVDGTCQDEYCGDDNSCPTDFVCVDKKCQQLSCSTTNDCPSGYLCDDGTCVEIECEDERDCRSRGGGLCVNGKCISVDCKDSSDCGEGFQCVDNECYLLPKFCTNGDIECAEDEKCVNGQCVKSPNDCVDGDDCEEGFICVDGHCIEDEIDECRRSSQCHTGFSCVDGICVSDDEEEDEDENPDEIKDDVLSDKMFMQTKALRLKPFSECLQMRQGKFDPSELERLDNAEGLPGVGEDPDVYNGVDRRDNGLRCGIYVNPTIRSEQAEAILRAGGGGSSECTTEVNLDDIEKILPIESVYGYKTTGSLFTEEYYFDDHVEKIQEFEYEGPGNQLSHEKTLENMSVWRSSESSISAFLDQVNEAYEIRINGMQEVCDQINEYGQLRDDNDPSKFRIIVECLDNDTVRKMLAARDFYDCMMADAQINLLRLKAQCGRLYDFARSFLAEMEGHRVLTNITKTDMYFGAEGGEVIRKEQKNYIHGGTGKPLTDAIKEIIFTSEGAYRGPDVVKGLIMHRNRFANNSVSGLSTYKRQHLRQESIDEYEYGVGTVKHTNTKIDYDNPLNNTTHIVLSTDNAAAPEAPPRNAPYDPRFYDLDEDGTTDDLDPDIDGDNILNEDDPNPRRFDQDIDRDGLRNAPQEEDPNPITPDLDSDGDGFYDFEDPDIDGDGIPNDSDPRPEVADSDIDGDQIADFEDPDIDGDGIPNELDPQPQRADTIDTDGDGYINKLDDDIDGDGFLNADDPDMDGDGTINDLDSDIDGDGASNANDPDMDADGLANANDPNPKNSFTDTDDDGTVDATDTDDDGDGLEDTVDPNPLVFDYDTDGDGLYDFEDPDIDGDGLLNGADPDPLVVAGDIDEDGLFDYEDDDMDGDGVLNVDDPNPSTADEDDLDGDGILDIVDPNIDGDALPNTSDPRPLVFDVDTDGDGIPDFQDSDLDGDGILNSSDPDADGDDIPGYADLDDRDPSQGFRSGQRLSPCNIETESYTINLSVTVSGNQTEIASINVGGSEEVSFPLPFLPLIPESLTALTLDQFGDPLFMDRGDCNVIGSTYREAASTRLASIERLCSVYMGHEARRHSLRGNAVRVVETMRPELFSWTPGMPVSVTSKGKTQGKYYTTSTTWGFDPYNMIVSLNLIGYTS
jgi:hypothetical protein